MKTLTFKENTNKQDLTIAMSLQKFYTFQKAERWKSQSISYSTKQLLKQHSTIKIIHKHRSETDI